MTRRSSVWSYLRESIQKDGTIHLSLIDPENQSPKTAAEIAERSVKAGTHGIMVGGSTAIGVLDECVKEIKTRLDDVPIILFPGNVTGISQYADAIFFMSLLNSRNPYWIVGAQMLGAPVVKHWNIEPISLAYLIIEPGGTAGFVGEVNLIPRNMPKITLAYALAAQLMGFKLIYLEAGSGAEQSVPLEMVKLVSQEVGSDCPVIVGGGIDSADVARGYVRAGASVIVQGTFVEKTVLKDGGKSLEKIIKAIKES